MRIHEAKVLLVHPAELQLQHVADIHDKSSQSVILREFTETGVILRVTTGGEMLNTHDRQLQMKRLKPLNCDR